MIDSEYINRARTNSRRWLEGSGSCFHGVITVTWCSNMDGFCILPLTSQIRPIINFSGGICTIYFAEVDRYDFLPNIHENEVYFDAMERIRGYPLFYRVLIPGLLFGAGKKKEKCRKSDSPATTLWRREEMEQWRKVIPLYTWHGAKMSRFRRMQDPRAWVLDFIIMWNILYAAFDLAQYLVFFSFYKSMPYRSITMLFGCLIRVKFDSVVSLKPLLYRSVWWTLFNDTWSQ